MTSHGTGAWALAPAGMTASQLIPHGSGAWLWLLTAQDPIPHGLCVWFVVPQSVALREGNPHGVVAWDAFSPRCV